MMVGSSNPSSLVDASPTAGDGAKTAGKSTLPEPRLLTKAQAAHYCALSCRGFTAWVKLGRLPCPIAGTTRWDRRAIDVALDEAMTRTSDENYEPYETWKAHYDENQLKRNPYSKKETR